MLQSDTSRNEPQNYILEHRVLVQSGLFVLSCCTHSLSLIYALQLSGDDEVLSSADLMIQNFWLYDSDEFQPDPNGIFAWLINELQDAEEKGQKAWITGHISPGKTDTLREPSRYLNQIIRRYKDTVCLDTAQVSLSVESADHPNLIWAL